MRECVPVDTNSFVLVAAEGSPAAGSRMVNVAPSPAPLLLRLGDILKSQRSGRVLLYVVVWWCVLLCTVACCNVLQCVAVCCSVLQCVAVCYNVSRCEAVANEWEWMRVDVVYACVRTNVWGQILPMHATIILLMATSGNTRQHTATILREGNTRQPSAAHGNTIQHNTLQHTWRSRP